MIMAFFSSCVTDLEAWRVGVASVDTVFDHISTNMNRVGVMDTSCDLFLIKCYYKLSLRPHVSTHRAVSTQGTKPI